MSTPAAGPDALHSSPYFRVYATLALAVSGLAAEKATKGPARAIRCETDGTLKVQGSSMTDTAAMPFKGGETQDVQAVALVESGSSGCVPITIFW